MERRVKTQSQQQNHPPNYTPTRSQAGLGLIADFLRLSSAKVITKCALAAVLCLSLFSCVSNTSKQQNNTNITLEALDNWSMRGKIGIKLGGKAKSANIEWRNHRKGYAIQIHGAFGLGSAELKKSGRKVTLKTKSTNVSAYSHEQLLEQHLGWSMPVSDLKHWIKGLPAPTSTPEEMTLNEQGLLTELTQSGWEIRFDRYQKQQGYTLPGKIIATHERLKITLIAKSWQIP